MANCTFCTIANNYPPWSPDFPPPAGAEILRETKVFPSSFVVLSTPVVLAFLDISHLEKGHLLVIPRSHRPQLTHATARESAELGRWLRILSAAVRRVSGLRDWNIVQNNGAHAYQTVFHAHFHIIPMSRRPISTSSIYGRGGRQALNQREGREMARQLREHIVTLLAREGAWGELS